MILTDRRRTNAGGLHFVKGGMAVAQNEHDFSKGSIPRNIMSLAVPMTAAQLVNVLYSVVDQATQKRTAVWLSSGLHHQQLE